jgi:HAD superfamily hydrolase (TIGR01549 family)
MLDAVLLDIDGTLIDNNPLHVLAWQRALRRLGKEVTGMTILHMLGMGGDQFAPAILGAEARPADVERLRAFQGEEYRGSGLIDHAQALPGALALLRAFKRRGVRVALASSANQEEVGRYLRLLDGGKAADAVVTGAEVAATKPNPDVFAKAMEQLGRPAKVLVIGDTVYDIQAAAKLGLPCLGLLSGGIEREVLVEAGAAGVFDNAADILAHLDPVLTEEYQVRR